MCQGKLYLCPTPIGNLEDITLRTLRILREADVVAAEDTRRSLTLLNHFEIKKPMISYFEHNKRQRGEEIIKMLKDGKNVALVTDAGTPAISDPGEMLVCQCIEEGIDVVPLPGACAVITALTVSGKPTGRFSFQGFLTVNKTARKEHLLSVKNYTDTLIFYEAPHKLLSTLKDMLAILGDREISLCRELTKTHEETVRLTISKALEKYEQTPPKGEFVLVIKGADEPAEEICDEPLEEIYKKYLDAGMSDKDALKAAAKDKGISKRDAYAQLKV